MSDFSSFESEADTMPIRPGQLSSNGQWIAGGVFALLLTIGFGFGLYAGTRKSAPEVAEKPKEVERPVSKPQSEPKKNEPESKVEPKVEPKTEPKVEPNPEPKPEPKIEPKIEPKKPDPEPKKKDPEPKKIDVKSVAFKEVAPLFRTYCGNCHGNAGKPKGGVDLRTIASITKGGSDGPILVVGNPAKSRVYASITDGSMPPDGKQGPNPDELKKIHDWILSGAKE